MQFKLFHNEVDCPFACDTDDGFAKEYLWYAEKFVSEDNAEKNKRALTFFQEYAPMDVGQDIDLIIRAYIFGTCEHISARGAWDESSEEIVSNAVNIYRDFIAVYENIEYTNMEPTRNFDNITKLGKYDIIASVMYEDLCRQLPKGKYKLFSSHILSESPTITVWKCKEIKRFPYYKLISPYVVIVLLTDNDCEKDYIVDLSQSIGPISPVFEIMEYDCKNRKWSEILGSGEAFPTSFSRFLGVDLKDFLLTR